MFRRLSEHDAYGQNYAAFGVIQTGKREIRLIDSGDRAAGESVAGWLKERGWRLAAIYHTHAHADHIGGNAILQQQTGCRIWAPERECDAVCDPRQNVSMLYGGYPPTLLRVPLLMAEPSAAKVLSAAQLPEGWEALPLSGHSPGMVGYRTADGNAYIADCLCSRQLLEHYPLTYIYDVAAYLRTLEKVKEWDAALFVPAHADPTTNIRPLAEYNADTVHRNAERICAICRKPTGFDDLLAALLSAGGMTLTAARYALVGSTLRSYLSWLCDLGRVRPLLIDYRVRWETVK